MKRIFKTAKGQVLEFRFRNREMVMLEDLIGKPIHEIFQALTFRGTQIKLIQVGIPEMSEDKLFEIIDEEPKLIAHVLEVFTKDVTATLGTGNTDEEGNATKPKAVGTGSVSKR